MKIRITSCLRYTHRQTYVQKADPGLVGLIISGLDHMAIYAPDGTVAGSASNLSLFLAPQGFRLDFSFNARRDNYGALCQIDALSWNPETRGIELDLEGRKINISPVIQVPFERAMRLSEVFQQICILSSSALETDARIGELLLGAVLAEFAERSKQAAEKAIPPAAEQLKKAIDEDIHFQHSLKEIMKDFPYTEVHLRRLFLRSYQTHPAEYRARLRFRRIQELLSDPKKTLKEIAELAGMNHVTHLHEFIRKRCGLTPAQLRSHLRN